jgi:hypothetical protein
MNRRTFLAGTALGTVALAGCAGELGNENGSENGNDTGEEAGGDSGTGSGPDATPENNRSRSYRDLSYEITGEGEDLRTGSGLVRGGNNFSLSGSFTVGPEDCFTSDILSISVADGVVDVLVGPVERDDAPEECTGTVIDHGFEVSFRSSVDPDYYLIRAEDYEEGEVVVYDSRF